MKVLNPLKAPFGKAKFSRLKNVNYRQWEDAFEVEFDDGLSFLEPHITIRKANRIAPKAIVENVEWKKNFGTVSSFATTTARWPKFRGRLSASCLRKSDRH